MGVHPVFPGALQTQGPLPPSQRCATVLHLALRAPLILKTVLDSECEYIHVCLHTLHVCLKHFFTKGSVFLIYCQHLEVSNATESASWCFGLHEEMQLQKTDGILCL